MVDFNELLLKLKDTLNKVTGIEKESVAYKIRKIEELLNDIDNNFNISTSKLVSAKHLKNKILIQQNLIKGYQKLIRSDQRLYLTLKEKIDFCKYKIFTYEKTIKDARPIYESTYEKIIGSVEFNFLKVEFDPIFEIKNLFFYVDSILKIKYNLLKDGKSVQVNFEHASELEIMLIGKTDTILGYILIPCDFFIDKENFFVDIDFENFNYVCTKISFKKELRLIRKNAGVVCIYNIGHGLEVLTSYYPKICGVCQMFMPIFTKHYRCFRCKFSCHKKCSDIIFFKCKRGLFELEKRWHNNYGIAHILHEKKLSGFRYCNHCGERITKDTFLCCERCDNVFHIDCKDLCFDSCQMDMNLRTLMANFFPKQLQRSFNDQKYNISNFELIRTLGKGNFGKVILAQNIKEEKLVALKILRKDSISCASEAKYLDVERRILKTATQCSHPFLMQMYYCFQDSKNIYFALEYLPGGDLFYHTLKVNFTQNNLKLFACEIFLGLEFLHKNEIAYRDLKLNNILLTSFGHIKLCDFGLCKENLSSSDYTYTFCGTLDTIAPEIIKNEGYTNAVDLWSYGIVLYQLNTKSPPFTGTTNRDICWSIIYSEPEYDVPMPEDLKDLIKKLLVKDPKKRLNLKGVKSHKYFHGVNWNDVFNLKIATDFKPENYTSNFDVEFASDLHIKSEGNDEYRYDEFFENFK